MNGIKVSKLCCWNVILDAQAEQVCAGGPQEACVWAAPTSWPRSKRTAPRGSSSPTSTSLENLEAAGCGFAWWDGTPTGSTWRVEPSDSTPPPPGSWTERWQPQQLHPGLNRLTSWPLSTRLTNLRVSDRSRDRCWRPSWPAMKMASCRCVCVGQGGDITGENWADAWRCFCLFRVTMGFWWKLRMKMTTGQSSSRKQWSSWASARWTHHLRQHFAHETPESHKAKLFFRTNYLYIYIHIHTRIHAYTHTVRTNIDIQGRKDPVSRSLRPKMTNKLLLRLQLVAVNSVVFTVKAVDADEDTLTYTIDSSSVRTHTRQHPPQSPLLTKINWSCDARSPMQTSSESTSPTVDTWFWTNLWTTKTGPSCRSPSGLRWDTQTHTQTHMHTESPEEARKKTTFFPPCFALNRKTTQRRSSRRLLFWG